MLSNASLIARLSTVKGYSGAYKRAFGWSCPSLSPQPNPPIYLDPSMQALLRDDDMSLLNHNPPHRQQQRELVLTPVEDGNAEEALEWMEEYAGLERKSPAALFGSRKLGHIVLPQQLQEAIGIIINDSDKKMLHSDAKRLFSEDETGDESAWQVQYDTKYRSRKQGERHAERDAIAFASVVLPAHYSALSAVLEHIKHRLGPSFEVDKVIEWGAGAGTGLWASLFSLQSPSVPYRYDMLDIEASRSTLRSYTGIAKREGMIDIARRIFDNIPTSEDLTVNFQKNVTGEDRVPRELATKTMALSAFTLSTLPTTLARKALVKEMWESGAQTIALIDHNTKEGFEVIAQAREYLLRQGRKEVEKAESEAESSTSIRGAYVVAPCPHDGMCPVFNSGSNQLVCGFSQRLQRPNFVRLTKHSGIGHEDIGYSYIVIQRGSRPSRTDSSVGRSGLVAQWAEEAKASKVIRELELFEKSKTLQAGALGSESFPDPVPVLSLTESGPSPTPPVADLQEALQQEAYHWPRLVFPPMKKNGHVILDSCTSEGKIMRITIPKSQGKQAYYDARKSSWGDLFPHPPKNAPQERVVVRTGDGKAKTVEGSHIGKNSQVKEPTKKKFSEHLASSIRESKKVNRRWERSAKAIWNMEE